MPHNHALLVELLYFLFYDTLSALFTSHTQRAPTSTRVTSARTTRRTRRRRKHFYVLFAFRFSYSWGRRTKTMEIYGIFSSTVWVMGAVGWRRRGFSYLSLTLGKKSFGITVEVSGKIYIHATSLSGAFLRRIFFRISLSTDHESRTGLGIC